MKLEMTYDETGDWQGREHEAAEAWNKIIVPVLKNFEVLWESEGMRDLKNLTWEKYCNAPGSTPTEMAQYVVAKL